MPRTHTWSTKATGGESVKFSVPMPSSPQDVELIASRFGSIERVFVCAARQRTVDVAPGIRVYLGRGDTAGAEKFAENFCDDGTRTAVEAVTVTAEEVDEQGFSKKNLAFLAAKGIRLS